MNIDPINYILPAIGVCCCLIMYIRVNTASENQHKILNAIYKYGMEQIKNYNLAESDNSLTFYDQIEPFDRTVWRLWDFECKNIVPKEVYEKIEPFISK